MKKIFLLSAALLAATVAQNAAAFQVDTSSNSTYHGSTRFSDPDDNLPVAHLDDNGTLQPAQPQQGNGNTGMSFGITPADHSANGLQYGQPLPHY